MWPIIRGVDGRAARIEHVEILRESFERPVGADAFLQRRQAHGLDPLQGAQDVQPPVRAGGGDAETAGTHDRGGHAMPGRDRQHRVPEHLGVVMGMDIDKTGRYRATTRVDHPVRVVRCAADGDKAPVLDADVADVARRAAAVDDESAGNFEIVHVDGFLARRTPAQQAIFQAL